MPLIRVFVAIEIPDEVRHALVEVQRKLKTSQAHVAWVPPPNLHLSMVFLGNIHRDTLPLVCIALDVAASDTPPFTLQTSGLGTFGGKRNPRVVWAGLRDSPRLMELQAQVTAELRDAGQSLEERAYHPHLTLGRVRSARGAAELIAAVDSFQTIDVPPFDVSSVALMQSHLSPAGARYERLRASLLRG